MGGFGVCATDGSPGCATGAGAAGAGSAGAAGARDAPEAAAGWPAAGALPLEGSGFACGIAGGSPGGLRCGIGGSSEVVALEAARCGAGTVALEAAAAVALEAAAVALEAAGRFALAAAAATAGAHPAGVKCATSVTSKKIAHIFSWSATEKGAWGFHHRAMLFAFTLFAVHPSSMIAPVAARLTRRSCGLWWPC